MLKLDARGLDCPAPVIRTKELVEREGAVAVKVTVDNDAARQNVARFLNSRGFETETKREGDDWHVFGKPGGDVPEPEPEQSAGKSGASKKTMIMVSSNRMGRGDDTLGAKLMTNLIKTLKEMGDELWLAAFINSGVKLTARDSEVLEDIRELEKAGTKILVCGTCLDFFNLLELKGVGETTNMLDIVSAMRMADKAMVL